jgi:hypothetical protein
MVAGISAITVFCLMKVYRPSLADRISLRLVFAANISGVMMSIWQTAVVFLPCYYRTACLAADFFLLMNDTASSLFLMFVGFNLMLLVVFRVPPSQTVEYGYYIFSCLVGLVNGLAVVLYAEHNIPDPVTDTDIPNCW